MARHGHPAGGVDGGLVGGGGGSWLHGGRGRRGAGRLSVSGALAGQVNVRWQAGQSRRTEAVTSRRGWGCKRREDWHEAGMGREEVRTSGSRVGCAGSKRFVRGAPSRTAVSCCCGDHQEQGLFRMRLQAVDPCSPSSHSPAIDRSLPAGPSVSGSITLPLCSYPSPALPPAHGPAGDHAAQAHIHRDAGGRGGVGTRSASNPDSTPLSTASCSLSAHHALLTQTSSIA